jgi:TRAP-type mannitol/chloroaromatic compound transport system substrate-binding protein
MHEPGSALVASMNLDVWNEMTPAIQEIISTAADPQWSLSQSNYNNGAALDRLKSRRQSSGIPNDVWDTFGTAAAGALTNMDDELFARIREARKLQCGPPTRTSISDDVFTVSAHASWANRRLLIPFGISP